MPNRHFSYERQLAGVSKAIIVMGKIHNSSLFDDPAFFPTREDADVKTPRRARPSLSVVRIQTPWTDASRCTSRRIREALTAFLIRPAKLPPDCASGPYPIAARLDLAVVTKGMALAREPSRAAFIRRVLLWRFSRPHPVVVARSVVPQVVALRGLAAAGVFVPARSPSGMPSNSVPAAIVYDFPLTTAQKILVAHGLGFRFDPSDRYARHGDYLFSQKWGQLCAVV
jgi:hypothetical protein